MARYTANNCLFFPLILLHFEKNTFSYVIIRQTPPPLPHNIRDPLAPSVITKYMNAPSAETFAIKLSRKPLEQPYYSLDLLKMHLIDSCFLVVSQKISYQEDYSFECICVCHVTSVY